MICHLDTNTFFLHLIILLYIIYLCILLYIDLSDNFWLHYFSLSGEMSGTESVKLNETKPIINQQEVASTARIWTTSCFKSKGIGRWVSLSTAHTDTSTSSKCSSFKPIHVYPKPNLWNWYMLVYVNCTLFILLIL